MSVKEIEDFLKKHKFNKSVKENTFWQDNGMYFICLKIYNNAITIHFEVDDDFDYDFPTEPITFYNITKNTLKGIIDICNFWINEVYKFA